MKVSLLQLVVRPRPTRKSAGEPNLFNTSTLIQLLAIPLFFHSIRGNQPDERYSFSLTTFDPNGRLGQVDRAQQSASAGTPIVGLTVSVKNQSLLILAAPQILPSAFMIDDGTPRFAQITDQLIMSHSGLSADGRVLVTAAQRIAIEHEYTFDEEIPCPIFLEQLSLLMLEYTMRAGTRPFGASLVVAHLPRNNGMKRSHPSSSSPKFYQIDPSGNIELLGNCAVIHGNNFLQRLNIQPKLEQILSEIYQQNKDSPFLDKEQILTHLVAVIREALKNEKDSDQMLLNHGSDSNYIAPKWTILTASLWSNGQQQIFSRKRHEL